MATRTLKKWSDFRIRDFAKIKGGKRLPKGEFVQDEKTAHPYIRVTDMFSDRLDTSKIKYITDAQFEKIKRYIISSDDVYVSNAGTIGLWTSHYESELKEDVHVDANLSMSSF